MKTKLPKIYTELKYTNNHGYIKQEKVYFMHNISQLQNT